MKAVINPGAGVDALPRLDIPQYLPIFRLEDVDKGALMAEYVVPAVIRDYRGLTIEEQVMRAGR